MCVGRGLAKGLLGGWGGCTATTCQSSCRGGNKSETNAIAEWVREKSKARRGKEAWGGRGGGGGGGGGGDVSKTSLNGHTFTVAQRNKWTPLSEETCCRETGNFSNSPFEGFPLFGVECLEGWRRRRQWRQWWCWCWWCLVEGGYCGALAAEAIWVSSTSKVGQLVPVPLLMC